MVRRDSPELIERRSKLEEFTALRASIEFVQLAPGVEPISEDRGVFLDDFAYVRTYNGEDPEGYPVIHSHSCGFLGELKFKNRNPKEWHRGEWQPHH